MALERGGWSYRIIDGPVDLDITDHIQGTPEVTWNAVGGCETASLKIDLPLSTFPTLGRRSSLIVTDHLGRGIWDGYCTDPGGVDDDAGEAFALTADGSMSIGALRVGRLVYIDRDLGSWTRSKGCVESAQTGQVDDDTFTGWRIGHPQGQVIGPGALAAIEYRRLAHSDHGIGRLSLTAVGAGNDASFEFVISTYAGGVVMDTISAALTTTPLTLDLTAGDEISVGCDAIRVGVVRVGGATNVTTPFAFVDIASLVVEGATVDQWGDLVAPGTPMTSARVVADLLGRGLLGPVDPALATITDSGVVHDQLSWATGIRGSAALEELRKVDATMTWMYGVRGPNGYSFSWAPWATGTTTTGDRGIRYDLTAADTVTSSGSTELPADRVMVIWTDPDVDGVAGEERSLTVELPAAADSEYARDLDPIVLGESTADAAAQAGLDALLETVDAGRTVTATVSRQILDRATGLMVEPGEIRPGCLARVEATGAVLRVQTVTARSGEAGGTAELTLGDPPDGFEERLLAIVRGELDPTAPLIPLPMQVPTPPVTTAPIPDPDVLNDPLAALITADSALTTGDTMPVQADVGDCWVNSSGVYVCTAAYTSGAGAMGNWTEATVPSTVALINGLAFTTKQLTSTINGFTATVSTSAPSGTAVEGARWVRVNTLPNWTTVVGKWIYSNGAWRADQTPATFIPDLSTAVLSAVSANITSLLAGAIITGVAGGTRVQITGSGIEGWTGSSRKFKLDASGVDVAAGNVVGATVATANSGLRAVLAPNPYVDGTVGLRLYDASDNIVGVVNAGAGRMTIGAAGYPLRILASQVETTGGALTFANGVIISGGLSVGETVNFGLGAASDLDMKGFSIASLNRIVKNSWTHSDAATGNGLGRLVHSILGGTNFANVIDSYNSSGAAGSLQLRGGDVMISSGSANLRVLASTSNSSTPTIGRPDQFPSVAFGSDKVRVCTWDHTVAQPIWASEFQVASDAEVKQNLEPVTGALDAICEVTVYDYDTPHGVPPTSAELAAARAPGTEDTWAETTFPARGLLAHEVAAAIPRAAYNDDTEDGTGGAVNLYALLTTAIAGIQELAADNASLTERLKALEAR